MGLDSKWAFTLMCQHLLAAADRYGLERLRILCEANLCQAVAINTVATTLALAEQHHCSQLKAVCLRFVAMRENLRGEFPSSVFPLSCSKAMRDILNGNNMDVLQIIIFCCEHQYAVSGT